MRMANVAMFETAAYQVFYCYLRLTDKYNIICGACPLTLLLSSGSQDTRNMKQPEWPVVDDVIITNYAIIVV